MKPIYLAHACSGYRLAYGASSPLYHLPAPAEGSQIPIISSKRFPKNGTMVDHRDWIELANDFPREIIPNPERSSMAVSPRPEVTGTSARKWSDVTSTVTVDGDGVPALSILSRRFFVSCLLRVERAGSDTPTGAVSSAIDQRARNRCKARLSLSSSSQPPWVHSSSTLRSNFSRRVEIVR